MILRARRSAAFSYAIQTIIFLLILLGSNRELKAQLTVQVEDHTGYERKSWPISGGIPFPKGEIYNADQVKVQVPSQSRILSRWSDGSIK